MIYNRIEIQTLQPCLRSQFSSKAIEICTLIIVNRLFKLDRDLQGRFGMAHYKFEVSV